MGRQGCFGFPPVLAPLCCIVHRRFAAENQREYRSSLAASAILLICWLLLDARGTAESQSQRFEIFKYFVLTEFDFCAWRNRNGRMLV